MALTSLLLFVALCSRDRQAWAHAALLVLAISIVGGVLAFFSGEPALTTIDGMPGTSGRALQQHHVLAVVASSLAATAALAAVVIVFVTRRRKAPYSRSSLVILLAITIASSLALCWTGLPEDGSITPKYSTMTTIGTARLIRIEARDLSASSLLGVDINRDDFDSEGEGRVYDLSDYTGLQFQARGDVPVLSTGVVTTGVLDVEFGGACVEDPKSLCDDFYASAIDLTADWKEYRIPFSEMAQAGWGRQVALDLATAVSFEFEIANAPTFDVSIDDVTLY